MNTNNQMLKLMKIVEFIVLKHDEQIRKGSLEPYAIHPIRVFNLLSEKNINDFDVLAASLLHDTLEDTNTTKEEIIALSNENVYDIVTLLTKEKGYNMNTYIDNIKGSKAAQLIKIADRIQNLQDSLYASQTFRCKYILETEQYFIDLSKDTIFENDLKEILNVVKNSINKDNEVISLEEKQSIKQRLLNKCLPYLKELQKLSTNKTNNKLTHEDYLSILKVCNVIEEDNLSYFVGQQRNHYVVKYIDKEDGKDKLYFDLIEDIETAKKKKEEAIKLHGNAYITKKEYVLLEKAVYIH